MSTWLLASVVRMSYKPGIKGFGVGFEFPSYFKETKNSTFKCFQARIKKSTGYCKEYFPVFFKEYNLYLAIRD